MKRTVVILFVLLGCFTIQVRAQVKGRVTTRDKLKQAFLHPPEAAKPWVLWYWIQSAISREGITADLEAMKEAGIGGAYLVSVKGPADSALMTPPVLQLTPQWWQMVRFAMTEADRLGIKLGMHDGDGFAVAGGPWITPEMSMQKLTWSKKIISGGQHFADTLPKPTFSHNYYKDVAVYAYPTIDVVSTDDIKPIITSNMPGAEVQSLADKNNKKGFGSSTDCWIQYAFKQPFTCRNITIRVNSSNYQAERLIIETSDDGKNFHRVTRLEPPRSGWQDNDADNTFAIPAVTAKYFRFVYDKTGTEPGAEDNEAAKWKPALKLSGIALSSEPVINQYQAKNGEVWRVAARTTAAEIPDNLCVQPNKLINLTDKMDANGQLNWDVPVGNWVILRIGHTTTGHMNDTGGAGKGLECDKFNPEAAKIQFDHWFGEALRVVGPRLAARVLKTFYIDSWEVGGQNWSGSFLAEFKKRRGYDLLPYLPVMAGVPLQSAARSEDILHDVRETIAELTVDKFYHTMATLAHAKGVNFAAESTAPTMTGDGMLHQRETDIPMGEFWLRSPTHDKPNDMLDAISAGHVYGKHLIQAEAFTEVRMNWAETPASLKTLGDRNFALGINRFVLHVFAHNPWVNRKPGMTLDGVGLYFQRNQTWFKPGRAWVTYLQRCQALLQMGKPVTDIAVFTGNEVPRRAVLPDRLVNILPGIFGADVVASEVKRLKNEGEPMHVIPDGVTSSANMAEAQYWVNPLRGYAYDSFNPDALLRLAKIKNGRVVFPGGASYKVLVIPGNSKMSPNEDALSAASTKKIQQLVNEGATVIVNGRPVHASGKGRVINAPYRSATFDKLGVQRDVIAMDSTGQYAQQIAWTHRAGAGFDIYFIANQQNEELTINVSLRIANKVPELWDAVTGETRQAASWLNENGRTSLKLRLSPNASIFVVLRKTAVRAPEKAGNNWDEIKTVSHVNGTWQVKFDPKFGGPAEQVIFKQLTDWSRNDNKGIKYYSGTAVYINSFNWTKKSAKSARFWLDVGTVNNIASVKINGIVCGVAWTAPYRVDITKALRAGTNHITIEVSNTWANRLIGDHSLPPGERITNTTAPYRLDKKPLLPAGLLGPVKIVTNDER